MYAIRSYYDIGKEMLMTYAVSYVAALLVFLSIDIIWIRAVMRPLFERNLGEILLETPRLGAAGENRNAGN